MESRCSAKLALEDAGALRMSSFSNGKIFCKWPRSVAASFSVHKYMSMVCIL